jgi:hypothetical protein
MAGRRIASGFAVLVFVVLVLKVIGLGELDHNIDATALILLGLLLVLAFIALAPGDAREVFKRMTSLRVGAIEVGLQATTLAERVELRVPAPTDDKVGAVKKRKVGGSAEEEFDEVRGKLVERLESVAEKIFGLDVAATKSIEIVAAINEEELLEPDEEQVIRDLLGDARKEVCMLDADARKRYLDGTWRFSSRFATLVLERRVRKAMTAEKWLLLDFGQTRGHRPDFIAFRKEVWVVAARIDPCDTRKARKRLAAQPLPFEARRVIIHPDSMKRPAIKDSVPKVELVAYSEIEATAKAQRTWKAPDSR